MFSGNFPEPFIVFRTIGAPAGERFGVGVMDKSGLSSDYTNRAHPGYVLVLLLRGRGVYRTAEGDAFALEPGSVFQRFRGVPHTTEVDPSSNWLECFIELGESVAALLANYALADPAEPVRRISPVSSLVDRFTGLGESFRTASDAELLRQHNASWLNLWNAIAAYYYALLGKTDKIPEVFRAHRLSTVHTLAPGKPMIEMIENQVGLAQGNYARVIGRSERLLAV